MFLYAKHLPHVTNFSIFTGVYENFSEINPDVGGRDVVSATRRAIIPTTNTPIYKMLCGFFLRKKNNAFAQQRKRANLLREFPSSSISIAERVLFLDWKMTPATCAHKLDHPILTICIWIMSRFRCWLCTLLVLFVCGESFYCALRRRGIITKLC